MSNRPTRIILAELAPRSHPLAASELREVFGGCRQRYESCEVTCDCCEGLLCNWGTCATQLTDPK